MQYIYDQLISNSQVDFDYYGEVYHLQQINRRGDARYYSFTHKDSEPILVIPAFYEQFLEVCDLFKQKLDGKKPAEMKKLISKNIDRKCVLTDFGNDKTLEFRYKDIRCSIDILEGVAGLRPEFLIVSGNIFGNHIMVHMDEKEELAPYYADRFPDRV